MASQSVEPCLQFERVSKRYRLGSGLPSLRAALGDLRDSAGTSYHWALKDVSFTLMPGEALGIIGPNGAGKTTILKILSRVTRATTGDVRVRGRLSALIELGAGFHPDLTGRENVFLNGTILGLRKNDIRARLDAIVDFAGIGQFLDTPVKRYSSGMYARLGFAIAAHIDAEILLIDEVLSVGDFAFQTKCHSRMDELRKNGTSLVFVSHNMEAVRRVCDRGLVLYRGGVVFDGRSGEAVVSYSDILRRAARSATEGIPFEDGLAQRVMTFDAEIECVVLTDSLGNPLTEVPSGSEARVRVGVFFRSSVAHPVFALTVRTSSGQMVYDTTTNWMGISTPVFSAGERCVVEYVVRLQLLDGTYELGVDVAAGDLSHYYDRLERALVFGVCGGNGAQGLANLDARVSFMDGVTKNPGLLG